MLLLAYRHSSLLSSKHMKRSLQTNDLCLYYPLTIPSLRHSPLHNIRYGINAGAGRDRPTILVLGDLSFFHDLNGLLVARLHELNLTIVLINNDGGGIFSFLPQAAYPEHFERLFGTPTGLDFRLAVQMYGGQCQNASSTLGGSRQGAQRARHELLISPVECAALAAS